MNENIVLTQRWVMNNLDDGDAYPIPPESDAADYDYRMTIKVSDHGIDLEAPPFVEVTGYNRAEVEAVFGRVSSEAAATVALWRAAIL